jgi:hypothetical protein
MLIRLRTPPMLPVFAVSPYSQVLKLPPPKVTDALGLAFGMRGA